MFTQTLFSIALAASAVLAAPSSGGAVPKCPIVFDGRVPLNATLESFDSAATNTLFNAGFVKGNNLTWSQILKFPNVGASRFDCGFKPLELTISDASIFMKQVGFRRAELQFLKDAADGEGGKGVKTLHWSVKQNPQRALNLTHEYLNVWHEAADFSSNQIQFQAGTLIGKSDADKSSFKILDRTNKQLWATPIDFTNWQNFAITLDYVKNEVTIFYSKGKSALKKVAGPIGADLSGGGQYHCGMLKKPTGTSDVANAGFQESPLDESQIYGGLFLEDSSNGCVSL
ncbi:glycoside hydrolase family 131 protein [Bipolaris victoriae FI3]|uniref:Glycoside hydrolase family 131 protein n=1 Tax=Bipolaris victoriae (strain FI3) TaxID=930091 RepID=W7EX90_BIPV3|nr:glycoside hydrolase family 131 protein [Bipolaris victoriae FI3]